jgi:hypothetical protein
LVVVVLPEENGIAHTAVEADAFSPVEKLLERPVKGFEKRGRRAE